MKKNTVIREQLGLTQQETAMILKISRSRWSLYELGLRDLPPEATKLLAGLLSHIKKTEDSSKNLTNPNTDKLRKHLEKLLLENKYQTAAASRIIDGLEKKQLKSSNALLTADYLSKHEDIQEIANTITKKYSAQPQKTELELMNHKLKLQLLIVEKGMLDAEIQKL